VANRKADDQCSKKPAANCQRSWLLDVRLTEVLGLAVLNECCVTLICKRSKNA